jgi:hypothetical protein
MMFPYCLRVMFVRDQAGKMLLEEPLKDEHFRGDDMCQECSNVIRDQDLMGAAISEEGRHIWQDLQEDHRAQD